MLSYLFESRSKPYDDEADSVGVESSWQWTDLLSYPLAVVLVFLLPIVILLYIIKELLVAALTAFWFELRSRIPLGER